jgi:hypothetical protein
MPDTLAYVPTSNPICSTLFSSTQAPSCLHCKISIEIKDPLLSLYAFHEAHQGSLFEQGCQFTAKLSRIFISCFTHEKSGVAIGVMPVDNRVGVGSRIGGLVGSTDAVLVTTGNADPLLPNS